MKKFEYVTKVVDAKGMMGGKVDVAALDQMLNDMGREGWELLEIAASNQLLGDTRYVLCIFKRELA